jgi:hypothetical protein
MGMCDVCHMEERGNEERKKREKEKEKKGCKKES